MDVMGFFKGCAPSWWARASARLYRPHLVNLAGVIHHNPRMSTRWWTFAVWSLASVTALYWGLKLFVAPSPVPARTPVAAAAPAARGDLTRLLGVDVAAVVAAAPVSAEPTPDARFQLVGVVSPRSKQNAAEGLAVIAVDGKPARAFRVGAVVDGQTVLQSVGARGAQLGPRGGAALVALNLTPLAAAATGTLPSATSGYSPPANAMNNAAPGNFSANSPPPMAPAPPGYGQPMQPPAQMQPGGTRRVLPPPMSATMPQTPMPQSPRIPGQSEMPQQ
jgi:general secretion pathway protein C